VGIRDAKIHLSKLLKIVQQGHEIILTDRGRPVGKLVPIASVALPLDVRIRRLEEQGILEPSLAEDERRPLPPPLPLPPEAAQRLLQEDRAYGTS
jgi:prevent-host-death family protein